MTQVLSPKQVASSLGVSESSLKRWCDQGRIRSEKTPGGHRRLRIGDVVQFLRETNRPLANAELLGLPAGIGRPKKQHRWETDALQEALLAGTVDTCRKLVLDAYLADKTVVEISERLITPVMHALGELWCCDSLEIYQERRACEIVGQVLHDLRGLLPAASETAPTAIGGAPAGDQYRLATTMVELTLREAGWNASSLGANLPLSTLLTAALDNKPNLFWLCLTHTDDADGLQEEVSSFAAALPGETALVVGGQAVADAQIEASPGVMVCRTLEELAAVNRVEATP